MHINRLSEESSFMDGGASTKVRFILKDDHTKMRGFNEDLTKLRQA